MRGWAHEKGIGVGDEDEGQQGLQAQPQAGSRVEAGETIERQSVVGEVNEMKRVEVYLRIVPVATSRPGGAVRDLAKPEDGTR